VIAAAHVKNPAKLNVEMIVQTAVLKLVKTTALAPVKTAVKVVVVKDVGKNVQTIAITRVLEHVGADVLIRVIAVDVNTNAQPLVSKAVTVALEHVAGVLDLVQTHVRTNVEILAIPTVVGVVQEGVTQNKAYLNKTTHNNEKRLFRHPIPPRVLQKLRQADIAHYGCIVRECDSCFCRRDTINIYMHKRLHRFLQR